MKKTVAFLTVWFFLSAGVGAQVVLPKKGYMHLSGFIGESQQVTVNLVKINDSIYCDYTIPSNPVNGKANDQASLKPRVIGGKVNPDGSFLLREPFAVQGPVITGRFLTRQTLTGTWEKVKGGESQQFSLSEVYPEGSIPLNVYYEKGSRPLVKTAKSPKASIMQCLVAPGESSDPVVSDSLNAMILAVFGGNNRLSNEPDTVLALIRKQFFNDYVSSNEDLVRQMGLSATMNWELLKMMHVVWNDHRVFSFYILSYAYTGGAHGLEMQEYTVADLRTGKHITLAALFDESYEPTLTRLLTSKLRESSGLSGDQKLSENGFFVDEVAPTGNIYLTGEGIGFYFNHYDIAPYSSGATDIFLTWEELRPILKPGVLPDGFVR